jgi:hypothetical protein
LTGNTIEGIALVAFFGGLLYGVTGGKDVSPGDPGFSESIDDRGKRMVTGLGVATGAALVALVGYFVFDRRATDEAATAFETYNASLRKKLDLCVEDKEIVPCGTEQELRPPTDVLTTRLTPSANML